MIGSLVHLTRNLRAGFVLAREGALALVDPSALPPAARLGLKLARLIERPITWEERVYLTWAPSAAVVLLS